MKSLNREQHTLDATGRPFGRIASNVAALLIGKHKIVFQREQDNGDSVCVQNISQMRFTGQKLKNKIYYRHSGYRGGLKEIQLQKFFLQSPEKLFQKTVYNMLPNNKFRNSRMKRLTFKH